MCREITPIEYTYAIESTYLIKINWILNSKYTMFPFFYHFIFHYNSKYTLRFANVMKIIQSPVLNDKLKYSHNTLMKYGSDWVSLISCTSTWIMLRITYTLVLYYFTRHLLPTHWNTIHKLFCFVNGKLCVLLNFIIQTVGTH